MSEEFIVPYIVEYARGKESSCRGPNAICLLESVSMDRKISQGELRLGTATGHYGRMYRTWRHWRCVSGKILSDMKEEAEGPEDLPGFDELRDEDKERVRRAWDTGVVPEYQQAEQQVGPQPEDSNTPRTSPRKVQRLDMERQELIKQNKSLLEQLKQVAEMRDDLQEEVYKLSTAVQGAFVEPSEVQGLREDLEVTQQQVLQLKGQSEDLEKRNIGLKEQLDEALEQVVQLKWESKDLEKRNIGLMQQLNGALEQGVCFKSEHDKLRVTAAELQHKVLDLEKEVASLKHERDTLQGELNEAIHKAEPVETREVHIQAGEDKERKKTKGCVVC